MIEDVKDLSRIEKQKKLKRKDFALSLIKCVVPCILATGAMVLFSLYMTGDFMASFTMEQALTTSGKFVAVFFLMMILFVGVYAYTSPHKTQVRDYILCVIMVAITFVASIATSTLFNLYAMPIALATLVLMELIDRRTATLSTAVIALSLLIAFMFSNESARFQMDQVVASVICNALVAVFINFFDQKHYARLKFFLLALLLPLSVLPLTVILTFAGGTQGFDLLWNTLYCYGGNIAATLVFMPLVAIFEGIFNIADDFRLNELCNLSQPLLKRLASEAPGTFNHSLVVGNLAQACASAIGENPNMARCAAYYHDIGKLKAPIYFSENQSSYNPHDELIPEVSVSMITSHTLFGEILAKQNRLPREIVEICRQHHGTSPVGFFYRKALNLKEEEDLAVDEYTYAGPKPQTKIAAIIMIADTIEAAMRAYMPESAEEYTARISKLVDEKLELHQFDECPITMGDIAIIKQTIIEVLPSIHHSRIDYYKKKKKA